MKKKPKVFYPPFSPVGVYSKEMKLGSDYMVRLDGKWYLCRFVKVTRKGFNLLDLKTNKCIIKPRHLYAPKWTGKKKEIPKDKVWFTMNVPEWVMVGANVSKDEEDAG